MSFAQSLETIKIDSLESWLDSLPSEGESETQEKGLDVSEAHNLLEGAVNNDVNAQLYLYQGDVCVLSKPARAQDSTEVPETNAVVVAVDSRLSPRDDVSKHVVRSADPSKSRVRLKQERHHALRLSGWIPGQRFQTAQTLVIPGMELPGTDFLVHTVVPSYNPAFKRAVYNAFERCVRAGVAAVLEHLEEEMQGSGAAMASAAAAQAAAVAAAREGTSSSTARPRGKVNIILTKLSESLEREGFSPEDAAHVVCRTLRAFLEQHGKSSFGGHHLSRVVLCLSSSADAKVYERAARLYFPRSKAEAAKARAALVERREAMARALSPPPLLRHGSSPEEAAGAGAEGASFPVAASPADMSHTTDRTQAVRGRAVTAPGPLAAEKEEEFVPPTIDSDGGSGASSGTASASSTDSSGGAIRERLSVVVTRTSAAKDHRGRPFTLYEIRVCCSTRGKVWHVWRRYKEFYDFRKGCLRAPWAKWQHKEYIRSLDFPPKRMFGSMDRSVVSSRHTKLQAFLRRLCRGGSDMRDSVRDFLVDRRGGRWGKYSFKAIARRKANQSAGRPEKEDIVQDMSDEEEEEDDDSEAESDSDLEEGATRASSTLRARAHTAPAPRRRVEQEGVSGTDSSSSRSNANSAKTSAATIVGYTGLIAGLPAQKQQMEQEEQGQHENQEREQQQKKSKLENEATAVAAAAAGPTTAGVVVKTRRERRTSLGDITNADMEGKKKHTPRRKVAEAAARRLKKRSNRGASEGNKHITAEML